MKRDKALEMRGVPSYNRIERESAGMVDSQSRILHP